MPTVDAGVDGRVLDLLSSHPDFDRSAFAWVGSEHMGDGLFCASIYTDIAAAAAQTKVKTLDAILGTSFWQGAWRNPELTTEEKLEQVAKLYADQLRALGQHAPQIPADLSRSRFRENRSRPRST